jgi:hypothetical protein
MKYGYFCQCGKFNLNRGTMTRKKYALMKQNHARTCSILAKELEASRAASTKGEMKK